MKREFITELIPEIEKEVLDAIMAENGKDIEMAKSDYKTVSEKLAKAEETLADYAEQIKSLEASADDADGLKNQIAELQKQIDERAEADRRASEEKAFENRFTAVIGENKFVNNFTRNGILAEFRDALQNQANAGKSDAEIYASITNDREGLFINPNPVDGIPPAGKPDDKTDLDSARIAMGLPPKN